MYNACLFLSLYVGYLQFMDSTTLKHIDMSPKDSTTWREKPALQIIQKSQKYPAQSRTLRKTACQQESESQA